MIYSIIESCRSRGIDPHAYMMDVLTRLPTMTNWEIAGITPKAWAEAKMRSLPRLSRFDRLPIKILQIFDGFRCTVGELIKYSVRTLDSSLENASIL